MDEEQIPKQPPEAAETTLRFSGWEFGGRLEPARTGASEGEWRISTGTRQTATDLRIGREAKLSAGAAGGLIKAVKNLGDRVRPLRPGRGIAGGGPQVDVSEPGGDLMDRDTGLEAMGRPVSAERVRVREPVGDTGGDPVAAHETVNRLGGERDGCLVRVPADPHEQRVLVTQRDPTRERMHLHPRLDRVLHHFGDRHLPLAPTLAAHEQPIVPSVRPRPPQVLRAEATELG